MNKKQEGLLRVLNGYAVDGIANVTDTALKIYCSTNTVEKLSKELIDLGVITPLHKPGFMSRYKINVQLDCYDFLIDSNFKLNHKATLLELKEYLDNHPNQGEYISENSICKEFGEPFRTKLRNLKDNNFDWRQILLNLKPVKIEQDLSKYTDTENGYIYSCKRRDDTSSVTNAWKRKRENDNKKENLAKSLYKNHKQSAKARGGKEFNLTIENIQAQLDKQEYKCYYSGIEFRDEDNYRASIDRIDSTKGYTSDNIVICLGSINIMKNTLSEEEFLYLITSIYNTSIKNS